MAKEPQTMATANKNRRGGQAATGPSGRGMAVQEGRVANISAVAEVNCL
jgi:hypothetical protein